jgi:Protein of unknown function (DUF2752)
MTTLPLGTANHPVGTGRGRHPRDLRAPLGVAALAAGAVGVVAVVDPNQPGHYPTCPFLWLTGLQCPGCGSLRAVHALAHGDIPVAVGLNVLTVLAAIALVVIWLRWVRRSWTGRPRTAIAPPAVLWSLAVAVVVFAVVRNMPFGAFLAP